MILVPQYDHFTEVGVTTYESFCFITFFHIVVDFCGGTPRLAAAMAEREAELDTIPGGLLKASSHESQLSMWRIAVYQTMLLPLWQMANAAHWEAGTQHRPLAEGIIHGVMLLHLLVAGTAMLALYQCCGQHELVGLNVLLKFLCIKVAVYGHVCSKFVSLFAAHVWMTKNPAESDSDRKVVASRMLGYLTLMQAQGVAILFYYVFRVEDPALTQAAPVIQYGALPDSAEAAQNTAKVHAVSAVDEDEEELNLCNDDSLAEVDIGDPVIAGSASQTLSMEASGRMEQPGEDT